jgi:short-subunit dehydrogenase
MVVLITGASEGIGAACARVFQQEGAQVSLLALPSPSFMDSDGKEGTLASAGDITDGGFRQAVVRRTLDHFGRIDVLINNVGVGLYAPPSLADVDLVRRLFDVNVFSPLALTQLVIPQMRDQGGGSIINIGSVGGAVSLPWAAMYCASKFAVHGVNDSLRREVAGYGIHVMKVCPGIVATKFRQHVLGGQAPTPVENIRRVVSPEQVAHAIRSGLKSKARTVYVPALSRAFMAIGAISPRLMDWYLRRQW